MKSASGQNVGPGSYDTGEKNLFTAHKIRPNSVFASEVDRMKTKNPQRRNQIKNSKLRPKTAMHHVSSAPDLLLLNQDS